MGFVQTVRHYREDLGLGVDLLLEKEGARKALESVRHYRDEASSAVAKVRRSDQVLAAKIAYGVVKSQVQEAAKSTREECLAWWSEYSQPTQQYGSLRYLNDKADEYIGLYLPATDIRRRGSFNWRWRILVSDESGGVDILVDDAPFRLLALWRARAMIRTCMYEK